MLCGQTVLKKLGVIPELIAIQCRSLRPRHRLLLIKFSLSHKILKSTDSLDKSRLSSAVSYSY